MVHYMNKTPADSKGTGCRRSRRRRPQLALAEQALGWHAAVSLESGLARTIEYFAAQPAA